MPQKTYLYNNDYVAIEFERLPTPISFPFPHIGRDGVKWTALSLIKDSEFQLPNGFDSEKTILFRYDGAIA